MLKNQNGTPAVPVVAGATGLGSEVVLGHDMDMPELLHLIKPTVLGLVVCMPTAESLSVDISVKTKGWLLTGREGFSGTTPCPGWYGDSNLLITDRKAENVLRSEQFTVPLIGTGGRPRSSSEYLEDIQRGLMSLRQGLPTMVHETLIGDDCVGVTDLAFALRFQICDHEALPTTFDVTMNMTFGLPWSSGGGTAWPVRVPTEAIRSMPCDVLEGLFEKFGVQGPAYAAIIGGSCDAAENRSSEQQLGRISEVRKVAIAEVNRMFGARLRKKYEQEVDEMVFALAALLCRLDAAGVTDCEGPTAHLPCFSSFGERWQHDSRAWALAIEQAARELLPGASLYVPNPDCLGIGNEETSQTISVDEIRTNGLLPWVLSAVKQGLYQSFHGRDPDGRLGLRIDREDIAGTLPSITNWAKFFNNLSAD